MAATAITNTALTRNTAATNPATAAVTANAGALITFDKDDQKILVRLKNAATDATITAVINKGNGLQGVANLEVTLAASADNIIVLESGAFKNMSGTNKGKVLITDKSTTSTALQVSAVVLP